MKTFYNNNGKSGRLHSSSPAVENYYFVLPIHHENKFYKQCNRQLNLEWKSRRNFELKILEITNPIPSYIILESGESERVKVIAYCSLSKIPSCARRCLLEVIVRDDHCFYLNIENIFICTRDLCVLATKFRYTFYSSCFDFISCNDSSYETEIDYMRDKREPEIAKKFIVTRNPREWIAKEQDKINEDLFYQRQNYYYYYYYNEDEDDDTYYRYSEVKTYKKYDGPPPPTSKEPYIIAPIQHHPELKEQCVRLINSEWPRSRMARFWSFETSTDTLPVTLVLAQMIDGVNTVLGHAKLSPVPADIDAAYLESVVIEHRYRGRGIGTILVTEVEQYCKNVLNINNVYLATDGQEVFYAKLGYIFCKAINLFGAHTKRNTTSKKHWMKKVISDWEVEATEDTTIDENITDQSSTNHVNKCEKRKNTESISDLIRNIRNIVYSRSIKDDSFNDLLLKMHSIGI
ncbi:uncharacterized protein LOC129769069 isoform X2 [Toxorhynchites rutilus septentrionalis]|uniref:uncharacterized protein LOC129769069 isoform X2 n=1 Tax=Toxorhynchites rutilus septentrionalis TaxID=329112 RepID=UPI00247A060F|nr:uncharacterized protein LOC129769069 isoform X2 [Toxorhynchites rutilus septentrionalis]